MEKTKILLILSLLVSTNLNAFNNKIINFNFKNKKNNIDNKKQNIININYTTKKLKKSIANDNWKELKELIKEDGTLNYVNDFFNDNKTKKPKTIIKKILKIYIPKYVNNSLYFDFNSYKLNNFEKKHLDKIINVIKKNNINNIVIVGYADKIGSKKYNLKLSKERAENVAKYITKKIPNVNIIIKYKGNNYTLFNKKNKIDRRVDIFFIK